MPTNLSSASQKNFKKIKAIAFDIDDTFTSDGKILAKSFEALWKLHDAGIKCVPITGRPAGWCDHIVRFWPVDAVVGENGAFSLFFEEKIRSKNQKPKLQKILTAGAELNPKKLLNLKQKILKKFPEATFASDQNYREHDLAVDFCEDLDISWPMKKVLKLKNFCESLGATAKISSIHLNTWFGSYTKVDGFKSLLDKNKNLPGSLDQWIFIGDSPNDEPMFEFFKTSVGVKNIEPFLKTLTHPPTYLTGSKSGEGFCELVDTLLESR